MNRPGPIGLLVLLAFAIPVIVEFRTVLVMVGIDLPARLYLPIAAGIVVLAFVAIAFLPGGEQTDASRA